MAYALEADKKTVARSTQPAELQPTEEKTFAVVPSIKIDRSRDDLLTDFGKGHTRRSIFASR